MVSTSVTVSKVERTAVTPAGRDILVVDDTPANLLAVEASLGDLASRVVRASSGTEALRRLLAQDFALILLDVQMPTLDGFQTARLIRERQRTQHTPIIFMTAFNRSDEEVLRAYELGAVDFLFKPIVPTVLRAKVSVLLDLQHRATEIERQAALLREAERREHERHLAEERRRWEAEALRGQMEEERRLSGELAHKAEELAREVGERERAERELKRINLELADVDRRKDEFLAVLGHELRNPLAPIVASLEILRAKLAGESVDPVVKRARDTMDRQVCQLRRLVDDLLDLSRINSGKIELSKQRVDLADVVNQAVVTCQTAIETRRHELVVTLPEKAPVLFADPVRLTQVLANLLNNSARYTSEGGRILLRCETTPEALSITVSDNGQGIPSDSLERIFEMFVQQRYGKGGLGIGLALVKRLVNLHGGQVTARSAGVDQGSEFEVRLPLRKDTEFIDDDRSVTLGTSAECESPPPALRIALIDDNTDIQESLSELLETWGHSVLVARDGHSGIDLILRERPQLAIVDIGLPELSGYEVAREVRRALTGVRLKLVAMSGYGRPQDRELAYDAGFDAHLVKPATVERLMEVLRDAGRAADSKSDGAPAGTA